MRCNEENYNNNNKNSNINISCSDKNVEADNVSETRVFLFLPQEIKKTFKQTTLVSTKHNIQGMYSYMMTNLLKQFIYMCNCLPLCHPLPAFIRN